MLKPQNIVQAAKADIARAWRNAEQAKSTNPSYEQYAFHRAHVRRSETPHDLMVLALMDPAAAMKTAKDNTRMIYGNASLLVEAIRYIPDRSRSGPAQSHDRAGDREHHLQDG